MLHFKYQDFKGYNHGSYSKYYSNVSQKLRISIGIQIAIYVIGILREIIRMLYPNVNTRKGWGKTLTKFGAPLQLLRYGVMMYMAWYFFKFETQVCLCSYRYYFYKNCYLMIPEDDVTSQIFDYQCYPKNQKYEMLS